MFTHDFIGKTRKRFTPNGQCNVQETEKNVLISSLSKQLYQH